MSGVYQVTPRADSAFRLGELDPPRRFVAPADGNWPAGIPGTAGEPYYERPAGYWKGAVDWETITEPKFGFNAAQNNNTDGLIDPDTNLVKTQLPPNSRSFILGPLVDGFVPNHIGDAFTRIGYIEKDTRQFVLLGIIQGEWVDGLNDEVSGGTYPVFNGQSNQFTQVNPNFTLDMALWFRNEMLKGRFVKNVSYNAVGGIPQQGIPDPNAPQTFGGNGVGGGSGNAGDNPDGTGTGVGSGGNPTTGTEQGDPDPGQDPGGNELWGMTQAEALAKYGGLSDEELAKLGIVRNPDGSLREMTPEELKAEREKQQYEAARKAMMGIARLAGISYSKLKFIFDKISPMGKMLDNLIKGDSGVEAIDRLLDPLARAAGKFAGRKAFGGKLETASNVMFRYDKWLASGGKKRVDVSNEVSAKEMKILQDELYKPGGFTTDKWLKTYMNHPPGHEEYAATKEDAVKIHAKYIQSKIDLVMTRSGTGLSMTFHNNVKLDMQRFLASGGKDIQMTKTYKFASGGSVGDAENTVLGQLLIGMGVELDRFGTGNIAKTMTAIIGSKYGLRNVNRMYGGKAYAAPGMPMRLKVPSPGTVNESIGSFTAFLNSINYDGDFLIEDEKPILLEDKKRILREIRQPLKEIKELPKTTKLKGYKPNFKGKYSPQNTPDVTASKRSDQLVMAKNAEGQAWTVGDKYQKGWETTGRMNHVYARVGESNKFFEEITSNNSADVDRKMQEHLNHVYHNKAMLKIDSNFKSPFIGDDIDESETYDNKINDPLFTKVAKRLKKEIDYPKKPAAKGYPNEAPPKVDPNTGYHPKFGKRYKYDKLDPISAKTMAGAPTGDPEIDANVKKAAKVKEDWRSDLKNLWLGSEREDWKNKIEEGMTTQMLTGILPSTGDADLETLQTGLTGNGDIDYGEGGVGDEVMAGEGEYTCFTNLDDLQNVNDPNNIGTYLRIFDQETKQFRTGSHALVTGGNDGYNQVIPGYKSGMVRNVKPSGDYNAYDKGRRQNKGLPLTQNGSDLYYHLYGQTNDVLGLGYGTWNSNDGVTATNTGTRLDFNGSGSPRFAALKAIDSTGFDTIKIHALLGDNDIVSTYRDSEHLGGTLRDKRVQIYYWAGDHKDYVRHPSASHVSGYGHLDGWRPINLKPNGEVDSDVDPYIIKHTADRPSSAIDANGVPYDTNNKLAPYSIPLPDYTRSKNARYMIVQADKTNIPTDAFSVLSVRFQRRSNVKTPALTKPLTDIETSPFVRVGPTKKNEGGKERKKKVKDIIDGGLNYTERKFSKDFPVRTTLE